MHFITALLLTLQATANRHSRTHTYTQNRIKSKGDITDRTCGLQRTHTHNETDKDKKKKQTRINDVVLSLFVLCPEQQK